MSRPPSIVWYEVQYLYLIELYNVCVCVTITHGFTRHFELVYTFLWILRSEEWTWHVNRTVLHKLSYFTSKHNLIKCPSYIIWCMPLITFVNVYTQAKFSLKICYEKWDMCRFENKRGTNVNTKLGQEKPDREMCMCSLNTFL